MESIPRPAIKEGNKVIVEGKIINHDSETYGQVKIGSDGIIEAVGENLGTADLKTEGLIFPGFIDLHVHAREDMSHSQDYKEDFGSASKAAIHGGVVAIADMPNNPIPPVTDKTYEEKKALTSKAPIDIFLYAGVGTNTKPLTHKVPYKVYMGKSVGETFFESFSQLEQVIAQYEGQSVSFHCEDPEILRARETETSHEARRPREAEASAVDFAILLAKKYKLQAKLCHIATQESVAKIAKAKKEKISVTAEVTPHHLYFEEGDFQVNPPLRTAADRKALLAALKSGTLDYLATDHAPHTKEEKEGGISGVPHLDTYGAFTTWLMGEHGFAAKDIARVCAFNPGEFINQFTSKEFGQIARGFEGSLTIIDPNASAVIEGKDLKTKCGWSPFEGETFPGHVIHTIIRGKVYDW